MNKVRIYTDGSYSKYDKSCGYGLIIFDGYKIIKVGGKVTDSNLVSMWNVGGEIMGVIKALEYCMDNSIDEVELIYDYIGLHEWVKGKWKITNKSNPYISKYVKYVKECEDKGLVIRWYNIVGHTDTIHNMADEYAKKGRVSDNIIIEYEYIM